MAHALDKYQSGPPNGARDRSASERSHQLVGPSVNDDGRRDDPAVVVQQATAAQDRVELPGDAPRVVIAVVALGGVGADLLVGRGVARTADDLAYSHRVLDDDLTR